METYEEKSLPKPVVIAGILLAILGVVLAIGAVLPAGTLVCLSPTACGGRGCVYDAGCGLKAGYCQDFCGAVMTTYCDCDGDTQVSSSTCVWEPHAKLGACE